MIKRCVSAARDGAGLTYVFEQDVHEDLQDGRLCSVLTSAVARGGPVLFVLSRPRAYGTKKLRKYLLIIFVIRRYCRPTEPSLLARSLAQSSLSDWSPLLAIRFSSAAHSPKSLTDEAFRNKMGGRGHFPQTTGLLQVGQFTTVTKSAFLPLATGQFKIKTPGTRPLPSSGIKANGKRLLWPEM